MLNKTVSEFDETLNNDVIVDNELLSNEQTETAPAQLYVKHNVFKPRKTQVTINKGESMLFENPYEAKSPQEIMELYGMRRRDDSMFPNNPALPQYGDFSQFKDFGERVNLYLQCKAQFDALPSEIRRKFDDNLETFSKYVNSSEFNPTYIMTDDYKKNYYEPQQRKIARDKAYQEFIEKQQNEQMNFTQ